MVKKKINKYKCIFLTNAIAVTMTLTSVLEIYGALP